MVYARRTRQLNKRPQTIILRRKESISPDKAIRRKSSMRPVNIEYLNPIY